MWKVWGVGRGMGVGGGKGDGCGRCGGWEGGLYHSKQLMYCLGNSMVLEQLAGCQLVSFPDPCMRVPYRGSGNETSCQQTC